VLPRIHRLIAALWLSLASIAAASAQFAQPASPPAASAATANLVPGRFVDVTEQAGVHFVHQAPHTSRKYLIETMGSGVAPFNCDNDGRLDLYLVNGAPYADPAPRVSFPGRRARVLEPHVPPEGRRNL
jgi:hypothetical protein